MSFFNGLLLLTKKELKEVFSTPLIYILTGLFSLIIGWLFFNYLLLSKDLTKLSLAQTVVNPIFGNMHFLFIFLAPLLTMRSFAEEKKNQTLDLLLRSRLNAGQIILTKILSSFLASFFMIAFTLVFPLILWLSGYREVGIILTSYVGLALTILCYVSVGVFASSLTENQILSAVMSFCIILGIMLLVMSSNASHNPMVGEILSYISVPYHYEPFIRGMIRSFDLVYVGSFVGFFAYLTSLSLESRNW